MSAEPAVQLPSGVAVAMSVAYEVIIAVAAPHAGSWAVCLRRRSRRARPRRRKGCAQDASNGGIPVLLANRVPPQMHATHKSNSPCSENTQGRHYTLKSTILAAKLLNLSGPMRQSGSPNRSEIAQVGLAGLLRTIEKRKLPRKVSGRIDSMARNQTIACGRNRDVLLVIGPWSSRTESPAGAPPAHQEPSTA